MKGWTALEEPGRKLINSLIRNHPELLDKSIVEKGEIPEPSALGASQVEVKPDEKPRKSNRKR